MREHLKAKMWRISKDEIPAWEKLELKLKVIEPSGNL
jgi:hypothetical protein